MTFSANQILTAAELNDFSTNSLGVGTTSPETPITIVTTNKLGASFTGTTDGEGLRVDQSNYTADNYVSLVEGSYDDSQTAPHVRIGAQFTGSGSKLAFGTSNSYASGITNQALTIDQAGNVGIGTTTPITKLEVADSNPATLTLKGTNTIVTAGTEVQAIDFYQSDASGGAGVSARIVGVGNNSSGAQNLTFHTGQAGASSVAERMRIESGGNVGIGTTSPAYTLDVTGPQDAASRVNITSGDTANRYLMRFSRNGSLFTQGVFCDTVNASFGTPSDANLKTAVESLDTAEALAAITALRAVSYRYLLDTDDVVRKGFIAQEVDEIIPEAVHRVGGGHPTTRLVPDENGDLVATDRDENGEPLIQEEPDWLMTYEAITTTLVAAVQAQQQIITDLERRVDALEA